MALGLVDIIVASLVCEVTPTSCASRLDPQARMFGGKGCQLAGFRIQWRWGLRFAGLEDARPSKLIELQRLPEARLRGVALTQPEHHTLGGFQNKKSLAGMVLATLLLFGQAPEYWPSFF